MKRKFGNFFKYTLSHIFQASFQVEIKGNNINIKLKLKQNPERFQKSSGFGKLLSDLLFTSKPSFSQ